MFSLYWLDIFLAITSLRENLHLFFFFFFFLKRSWIQKFELESFWLHGMTLNILSCCRLVPTDSFSTWKWHITHLFRITFQLKMTLIPETPSPVWLIWYETSNFAPWLRNLSFAWPFDDDLILILLRPQARATVSCRGHTLTPFLHPEGPLTTVHCSLPIMTYPLSSTGYFHFDLVGVIFRVWGRTGQSCGHKGERQRGDRQWVNSCDFKDNLW